MNFMYDDPEELSRLEAAKVAAGSHAKNGVRAGALLGGLAGILGGGMGAYNEGDDPRKGGKALAHFLAKAGLSGLAGAGLGAAGGGLSGGAGGAIEGLMTPQVYRRGRR